MKKVSLEDKNFKLFIESAKIQKAIDAVSIKLNNNYAQKSPIFVCILNGSFMFASDLIRTFTDNCEVTFLKVSSYDGTKSTGSVKELIGLNESITGRDVIIVEDIVDTGATLEVVIKDLNLLNPKSIKVATLLYKPLAYKGGFPIDYAAIEVGNEFLVGYGLDYNGLGRNLEDIYIIEE
jgi:hypoxanthine phosphoribosyltransferase